MSATVFQRMMAYMATAKSADDISAVSGGRRFAVGIRLPGVHRRNAGLGAVADQQEDKRQLHHFGLQHRRDRQQHRPVERILDPPDSATEIEIGEHRARKGQGNADRAEQDVLPRGFHRRLAQLERNDEGGEDGGRLDGNPHHAHIVGRHGQQHDGNEQIDENLIAAQMGGVVAGCAAQARAEKERQRGNGGDADHQQGRQAVGAQHLFQIRGDRG